jgi:hypothetical protein
VKIENYDYTEFSIALKDDKNNIGKFNLPFANKKGYIGENGVEYFKN